MHKLVLLAFFYLCYCTPAFSDTLEVTSSKDAVLIGKYASMLEDPSGRLTIKDVIQKSEDFRPVKTNVPLFSRHDCYIWVKLVLVNKTDRNLWLGVGNPSTDTIQYYEVLQQGLTAKLSGDKVPFNVRDVQSSRILFHITYTNEPIEIYLRLNIRLPRQFPLYVTTGDVFLESGIAGFFVDGLFYGLILVIVLYNLFLWFTLKELFYLYYISYILFSGLLLLHFDGITYAYLWRDHPWLNDHPAVLASIPMLFALLFVSSFLDLKNKAPYLLKGLWVFGCLWVCCSIVSLAGYKFFALSISQSTAFFAALYFLLLGIVVYRKGYQPARYYLAAWTLLIISVIVFICKDLGWISFNSFTANALKIGIGAEAVMMAFALADRISFYRSEQQRFERQMKHELEQRLQVEGELKTAGELLAEYTNNLKQKNALIEGFRENMEQLEMKLKTAEPGTKNPEYIEKLMQSIILTEDDWFAFRNLFDKVHTGYIFRLREKYHTLTETDVRLLTLMKLQLNNHEMANMLGVTVEAIRKAKQRLKKKLSFRQDDNLEELVAGI